MSHDPAASPLRFDVRTSPLAGINLIEASAGTGKTHALAGLFLRLVVEGGSPGNEILARNILVVTYTEAATAELRERIRVRLQRALRFVEEGDPGDLTPEHREILERNRGSPGLVPRLRDAVRSFDEVEISTIHGFCRSVLAQHAFESGAGFQMELQADQTDLEQEVTDDFWRSTMPTAPVSWLRLRRAEGRFKDGPEGLVGLLRRRSLDPGRRVLPDYQAPEVAGLEQGMLDCFRELRDIWGREAESVRRTLLEDPAWNRSKLRLPRCTEYLDAADQFFARGDPWDPALLPRVRMLAQGNLDGKTKGGKEAPRHELFRACDELERISADLEEAMARYEHVLERSYLEFAERELEQRKRRRGIWFFDDLLVQTFRALEPPTGGALGARLRERYRAALIDEFQDTDPLQYRIFLHAFGSGDGVLYLIGDPKQAIYGFRGADIYAYLEAARHASSRLALDTNYRSVPSLVGAVNELFGGHGLPFVHREIQFHACAFAAREGDASARARTALVLEVDGAGKMLHKGEALRIFSEAASRRVLCLLDQGFRPHQIAVLVRSNRQAQLMQQALRAKGVPGVLYSADSVYASDEAAEVGRIIAALVRPGSEAQVRAALSTRILGLNASELDALPAVELEARMDRFRLLSELWQGRGFLSVMRALLDGEGARERLLGLPDGERRLTNVLHLAELLHRAERESHLAPEDLLSWLQGRRASGGPGEEGELRLETDEEAVTISTIHHAKGLEHDVVLCPFLWDGVGSRRDEAVVFHDVDGTPILDLEGQEQSRRWSREEELAELMRLAYVALTRAKRECYVSWGWVRESETSPLFCLLHCRDMNAESLSREGGVGAVLHEKWAGLTAESLHREVARLADCSNGTLCVEPMGAPGPKAAAPRARELTTGARAFERGAWRTWSITSYSGLTRGRHREAPERDRDVAGPPVPDSATEGILGFPRGSAAGTFIHAILEEIDLATVGEPGCDALLADRCRAWGYDEVWVPALREMAASIAAAPLEGDDRPLRLAEVARGERLTELEFHLPVSRLTPETLGGLFARSSAEYGDLAPVIRGLGFGDVTGFLQGFIDLVFRSDGKYYIVDWKSNYLGADVGSYGPKALADAMRENLYSLQLTLYAVALDRYLALRDSSHEYGKDFGGVFYLFVRGVQAGDSVHGIFRARPPEPLIHAISDVLGGSGG